MTRIRGLGLEVAETKTEAILCGRQPRGFYYQGVGNMDVPLGRRLKYLRVIIDNVWNFNSHFNYMEEKASRVVRALGRLMPNLRGPMESKQKLYYNVVLSIVLYGAPIWSDKFFIVAVEATPVEACPEKCCYPCGISVSNGVT